MCHCRCYHHCCCCHHTHVYTKPVWVYQPGFIPQTTVTTTTTTTTVTKRSNTLDRLGFTPRG